MKSGNIFWRFLLLFISAISNAGANGLVIESEVLNQPDSKVPAFLSITVNNYSDANFSNVGLQLIAEEFAFASASVIQFGSISQSESKTLLQNISLFSVDAVLPAFISWRIEYDMNGIHHQMELTTPVKNRE